ncbi:hypothetical protein TWF730_005111 [Orbilia blumenaviensis]|uniref:F-box domain-containing protein n=1 Tax=Orbilia blumenaviensis TaxID=1796055 RepID=A0AAV9VJL6_9PEZI
MPLYGSKISQKQHAVEASPNLNGLPENILLRLRKFLTVQSRVSLSLVSHRSLAIFRPAYIKSTSSETCLKRTITRLLSPNIDPIGGSHNKGLRNTIKSLTHRQPPIQNPCLYCGSLDWCPAPGSKVNNGRNGETECCNSPGVLVALSQLGGNIFYDESIVSHKVDGYAENQGDLPYSWSPKEGGIGDNGRPAKPKCVGHRVFRPYTRWCRHHRCEGYIGTTGRNAHDYTDDLVIVDEESSDIELEKWRRWCNHCDLQMVVGWNARRARGMTCKCTSRSVIAQPKKAYNAETTHKIIPGCEVCGWKFVRVLALKSKSLKSNEKGNQVASIFLEAGWKAREAFGITCYSPEVRTWEILDIILDRELGSTQEEEEMYERKIRPRPKIYDLPVDIITKISREYLTISTREVLTKTDPAFAQTFGWQKFKDLSSCASNLISLRSGNTDSITGGLLENLNSACKFCSKTIRRAKYRTIKTNIGLAVLPARLVNPNFRRPKEHGFNGQYTKTIGAVCPSHGVLNNSSVLDGFGETPGAWIYPPIRAGIVIWCLHCQAIRGRDIKVPIETVGKKQVFKLNIGDTAAFWVELVEPGYVCKCVNKCEACGRIELDVFAGRMRDQSKVYSWIDIWWMEFKPS